MPKPESTIVVQTTQVFSFRTSDIRSVLDEYGKPWFVGADAARMLGYVDIPQVLQRLPSRHKRWVNLPIDSKQTTRRGENLRSIVISEAGLYRLILRSQLPEAEAFQDWVCEEVLPALRRTGTYTVDDQRPALLKALEAQTPFTHAPTMYQYIVEESQKKVHYAEAERQHAETIKLLTGFDSARPHDYRHLTDEQHAARAAFKAAYDARQAAKPRRMQKRG